MIFKSIKVTLLAAVASNGVIGNGQALIPPLEGDLAKFKQRTSKENSLIVMGRNTFEGMPLIKGVVLPGRNIAVLTSKNSVKNEPKHSRSFWLGTSVEDIIMSAMSDGFDEIFLCGGAETYKAFLDAKVVDEMILTMHNSPQEGDKYFPEINQSLWKQEYRMPCFKGGYEVKYVFAK